VLRWRIPPIVATLLAFAVLLALAACGDGRMLPAPVRIGQSPYPLPQSPPGAQPPPGAPTGGPLKVALLVPLSGPNAELGKSMLEAAQLALFTIASNTLTLVPRDSGGTPQAAAAAVRSALTEGAKLIIGPLLAAEAEAVKPIARDGKVNVIAFSTATQLAGDNLFLMGFLPRQEVVREVSFAHERGLGRFAALVPNSPYGRLMSDALQQAAAASGGSVVKVEQLSPSGADAATAIRRLLPAGGAPPNTGEAVEPPPAVPAAKPGFDALLLPEGGAQLKSLAQQLRAAGLDTSQVRLLGSGLWDDASITGEPALYGGWFAASPPETRREFESRFSATYGHPAPRLASLAFDAAALAAALAKGGEPFSREAILNPNGFTGVDGLFRFTPQGLVQRGLAVLEVAADGDHIVSPAPTSFQDIGY
jgi:ABC-type branched-subunit amino acid transport system substrate-binding protein